MALSNLEDALKELVKDLYNAEKQLVAALPRMAKGASTPELQEAIEEHLEVTQGQVERLEKVFGLLEMPVRGKHCKGMEGLIDEGKEVLAEKSKSEPMAIDAALITAAQKVEHYEMSGYGSARAFAETLGMKEVASLLQESLDEESEANDKLTEIAEQTVNPAAAAGAEETVGQGREKVGAGRSTQRGKR